MPLTVYPSINNPRQVKRVWIFTSGAWKEVKALFTYVGGLWRKIYESTVTIDINFSAADQNLRTIYINRTGDSSGNPVDVVFNLLAGYTLYASSVSNYGLTVGNWPGGSSVTLRVNGRIVGAGGAAGFTSGNPIRGTPGGAGGPALRVNYNNFTLINNGTIAGGGGGGGPACAGCCTCFLCTVAFVRGGVGAGVNPATGGGSGCSSKRSCNGNTSCCSGGSGGDVGSPGSNGRNGCGCNIGTTAGGAAGTAIVYG